MTPTKIRGEVSASKGTRRRRAWLPRRGLVPSVVLACIALACIALACVALVSVALASTAEAFNLEARLTPNLAGSPTNFSSTMTFGEGGALPKPVRKLVAYGPAGLRLNVHGVATCKRAKLEAYGPAGCPAESRVGFGGGVGVVELGASTVREPYTLDFFLASRRRGHVAILVYARGSNPIEVELVLVARETHGPSPYGLGLVARVPAISTVPGGADVSVEDAYVSLGASDIAYYRMIHGRRRLVRVKGLVAPRRCHGGSLRFEAIATFEDDTTDTGRYSQRCPKARR